jgi:hypothetical protein
MFKSSFAITIFTLFSLTISAFATAEVTETDKAINFHFEATLKEGSDSLRRFELPWEVVSNLLQKDLKDLQIYNADEQAIPFSIRKLGPERHEKQKTQDLSFFPMGEIEKLGTVLKQQDNKQGFEAIKLIRTGQRYLIIDSPNPAVDKQTLPLRQLTLNWEALNNWLPKSLKIEASDDLTQWETLAIKKLPFQMIENDTVLDNHQLSFKQPTLKRFIRLSGDEDFEPLLEALKSVSGDYYHLKLSSPINWNRIEAKNTESARQYYYDLPISIPFKRWGLEGQSKDSLYKGRLLTAYQPRHKQESKQWQSRQGFLQYSLQTKNGLVVSREASQGISQRWSREWRIDLEHDISEEKPPQLALAWEPLELVFLAQGKGPFKMRFASRTAEPGTRLDLNKILRKTTPQTIEIGSINQLSEIAPEKEDTQYKYLLWGLLAAAVLMLLFMAKGLLREMSSKA